MDPSASNDDLIQWLRDEDFHTDCVSRISDTGIRKISELRFLGLEDLSDFHFLNWIEKKKLQKLWHSTVEKKLVSTSANEPAVPCLFIFFARITSCSVTDPLNQWHQITIPETDLNTLTYSSILESFFDAVTMPEDTKEKVRHAKANKARIRLFTRVDGGTPILVSSFNDVISAISSTYKYVSFDFKALKDPNAKPINPLQTMMKNAISKELHYPTLAPRRAGSSTDFKADLFNTIVGRLQEKHLGVSKIEVVGLEQMVKTIRDTLVLISSHVPMESFPEFFQHSLKKSDERERGSFTQDNLKTKISNLDAVSISCSGFLALKRFKVVHTAISELREILNMCILKLCKNVLRMLKSQQRAHDEDHNKIHGKRTNEASKTVDRDFISLRY